MYMWRFSYAPCKIAPFVTQFHSPYFTITRQCPYRFLVPSSNQPSRLLNTRTATVRVPTVSSAITAPRCVSLSHPTPSRKETLHYPIILQYFATPRITSYQQHMIFQRYFLYSLELVASCASNGIKMRLNAGCSVGLHDRSTDHEHPPLCWHQPGIFSPHIAPTPPPPSFAFFHVHYLCTSKLLSTASRLHCYQPVTPHCSQYSISCPLRSCSATSA